MPLALENGCHWHSVTAVFHIFGHAHERPPFSFARLDLPLKLPGPGDRHGAVAVDPVVLQVAGLLALAVPVPPSAKWPHFMPSKKKWHTLHAGPADSTRIRLTVRGFEEGPCALLVKEHPGRVSFDPIPVGVVPSQRCTDTQVPAEQPKIGYGFVLVLEDTNAIERNNGQPKQT